MSAPAGVSAPPTITPQKAKDSPLPGGADDALEPLGGGRKGLSNLRPSPIADAKKKTEDEPSSLKIHITLDLDVEIHLTARIKGDIVIGLL